MEERWTPITNSGISLKASENSNTSCDRSFKQVLIQTTSESLDREVESFSFIRLIFFLHIKKNLFLKKIILSLFLIRSKPLITRDSVYWFPMSKTCVRSVFNFVFEGNKNKLFVYYYLQQLLSLKMKFLDVTIFDTSTVQEVDLASWNKI